MYKSRFLFCLILSFFSFIFTNAQNNTNSPYTRFGYGELSDPGFGKQITMGGVAFGDRSSTGINPSNPASYSSIDSLTFIFETGANARLSSFSQSGNQRENNFNANINYLAMEFPVTKWLASSIGMIPYSFSGYNFSHSDSITVPTPVGSSEQKAYYTETYNGEGGINQVYVGLSAKFFNHIAIGVNASYLFGFLTNTRELSFTSSSYSSSTQISNLSVSDINLRYGIQFFHTFAKYHTLTIGGVFENKSNLNGSYQVLTAGVDTTNMYNAFESPLMYGAGLYYSYKNKLSVGADFMEQQWANAKYFGVTDTLKNRTKISLGAQYQNNSNAKDFWNRAIFRLGANYASSYILSDPNAYDLGITLGLGIPLKGSKSFLNFGLEYGKTGNNSLLREDYLKLSINATFNELWFFKRRFE